MKNKDGDTTDATWSTLPIGRHEPRGLGPVPGYICHFNLKVVPFMKSLTSFHHNSKETGLHNSLNFGCDNNVYKKLAINWLPLVSLPQQTLLV